MDPRSADDARLDRRALEREAEARPLRASPNTVIDMVMNVASRSDRGPTFLDGQLHPRRWTFAEVVEQALRSARFLREQGVIPGACVALILPDSEDFMTVFLGAILAGATPVPLAIPISMRALASYARNCESILESAGCESVVVSDSLLHMASAAWPALAARMKVIRAALIPRSGEAAFAPHPARPGDTCFLQFTSGSTGTPKGVIVTHENLVANAHAIMHDWLRAGPRDIGATWLPLFHDMGLIGFVIAPLLTATPVVFIPTLAFIQRPTVWMRVISEYRASITVAPNFALALAVKRPTGLEQLDLSCLRVLGCGAEPINPSTLQAFEACHRSVGLAPGVISPVYGLAEATLLASCAPAGSPHRILEFDTDCYERERRIELADRGGLRTRQVSCGRALPGHTLQVWSPDGVALPEGTIGEIVLSGPSRTRGYYGSEGPVSPFLHTGDLGFLLDGELYVCGRSKDLLIVNGRNLHPQDLEWEIEQLEGVRRGSVVAFAAPGESTEELVVLVEAAGRGEESVTQHARRRLSEQLGVAVRFCQVVPRGSVPKTSSGKLQRARARELWLAGHFSGVGAGPASGVGALPSAQISAEPR